jgi:hypothetical protein
MWVWEKKRPHAHTPILNPVPPGRSRWRPAHPVYEVPHASVKHVGGERAPGRVFLGLDERHSRVAGNTQVGMSVAFGDAGALVWGPEAPPGPWMKSMSRYIFAKSRLLHLSPGDPPTCIASPVTKPLRFSVNPVGSQAGMPGILACRSLCRMFIPRRDRRRRVGAPTGVCSRSCMGLGGPIAHC